MSVYEMLSLLIMFYLRYIYICTHAHVHVQVFSFSSYHVIPCPMLFLSVALHTSTFNVLTSPFIARGPAFHDAGTDIQDDPSAQ